MTRAREHGNDDHRKLRRKALSDKRDDDAKRRNVITISSFAVLSFKIQQFLNKNRMIIMLLSIFHPAHNLTHGFITDDTCVKFNHSLLHKTSLSLTVARLREKKTKIPSHINHHHLLLARTRLALSAIASAHRHTARRIIIIVTIAIPRATDHRTVRATSREV